MARWVFVMTGDMEKFKERIESGKWPIFSKTHHRKEIRSGDHVIFYLGGKPNKKLVGKTTLSSALMNDEGGEYLVSISNVEIWKEPVLIKTIVGSLSFIKNKDNWGMHLQGGVVPLPAGDYDKILRYAEDKTKRTQKMP